MFGKVVKVAKETKVILKQFFEEHKYEINPVKDETHLEVTQDETFVLDEQANEQAVVGDDTNNQKVIDSNEVYQTPLVTNVEFEKDVEEVGSEKGEEAEKEKDGDNIEQVSAARDIVTMDKGKQIIIDTDLTKGHIDLNSLSPVQALNLATLA